METFTMIKVEQKKNENEINNNESNSNSNEFDFSILRAKIEKSYKQISISRKMRKFYKRRYQLFHRFDLGVLLDLESWYSVTPEQTAAHIAHKCFRMLSQTPSTNTTKTSAQQESVCLDGFCGSGGNSIQFARLFDRVISAVLSRWTIV